MDEVRKWLIDYLSHQGCTLAEVVRQEAKRAGITKAQLREARRDIGVKTFHQFDEIGQTPNWFWYL